MASDWYLKIREYPQWLTPAGHQGFSLPQWSLYRENARTFKTAEEARAWLAELRKLPNAVDYKDAVPARRLDHREAKKKAAAFALRNLAFDCDYQATMDPDELEAHGLALAAQHARKKADELWPPKRAAERGGAVGR